MTGIIDDVTNAREFRLGFSGTTKKAYARIPSCYSFCKNVTRLILDVLVFDVRAKNRLFVRRCFKNADVRFRFSDVVF